MRLHLINPSNPLVSIVRLEESRWNRYRVWQPLSLMVLAGLTPPEWDVTLLDENISREHALILYDQELDRYTIEDLQSTNGTKVNGKRVRSAELNPGDTLQIGSTLFEFVREG